jgi:hypothetical protein
MSFLSSCIGKKTYADTELVRVKDTLIRLFDPSRTIKEHKAREAIVFRFLVDRQQRSTDRQSIENLLHYKFMNSQRAHYSSEVDLDEAFSRYKANQLEIQIETLALFNEYLGSLSGSNPSKGSEQYARLISNATTFRRKYRARLNHEQRYALDVALTNSQRKQGPIPRRT